MQLLSPLILRENQFSSTDLNEFCKSFKIWKTVDIFENQLSELFEVRNPKLQRGTLEFKKAHSDFLSFRMSGNSELKGSWIYFPWSGRLVHMVEEEEFIELLTNRNRNLISSEEQNKLRQIIIGVVGLSVGGAIATTLADGGLSGVLKLAEYDSLSTTNLNRLCARVDEIGKPKIQIISEQIYEHNPYITLHFFPQGLNNDNIALFCDSPRPSLLFEAVDDFIIKIRLRQEARSKGIPVAMFTNLGDSILIDIERFDLEPNRPLFHGLVPDLEKRCTTGKAFSLEETKNWALRLVDVNNVPERARFSVAEIGKTLVGRPQLFGTVTTGSGIAAYLARAVALNYKLPSGRYKFIIPDIF